MSRLAGGLTEDGDQEAPNLDAFGELEALGTNAVPSPSSPCVTTAFTTYPGLGC